MFGALTTLSKLAKNGDQARSLRNQLFPLGLSHNNKSHLAEAGHAAAVATAMTDDQLTFLKSLPLDDSTMFDLHNQWQSVSTQMGAVEEKRALLKHPSKTLAAQTQAARREWIRWTKILVTTAENAGIGPADDALLFAPLREAMQKADDRWSNSPKPTPPAPAPSRSNNVEAARPGPRGGGLSSPRFQGDRLPDAAFQRVGPRKPRTTQPWRTYTSSEATSHAALANVYVQRSHVPRSSFQRVGPRKPRTT